jgi:rhodanese-related sulfurtransferase
MGKILSLAIALLVALVATGCSSSSAIGEKVDPASFLSAASQPGVVILDVRSPEEYAQGHLPEAVNINVEDPGFDTQVAALDPGVTYVLYCRSGRRSAIAAQRMADAGFTSIIDLEGGLAELAAAGATVVVGQ